MASALFNGASTTKADKVKLFMKELKAAVRKENESSTKIRSFNKLLRRVPDLSPCGQCKFEFSKEQLTTNKKLYVDTIIFVCDVPWSIHLEPHNMFSTSGISYDIVIKCYFPGAVCQEDSEIFASIRFSGPAPISAVTKTQYFRQSHKMFVLPDCISDNKLKLAKTNKRKKYEFSVSIEIKNDKRKKHETKLPPARMSVGMEHWDYMAEHMMSPTLPSVKGVSRPNAIIVLSALYNLLSEETMRLSTGETWFKMLDYMTCTVYRYWWKDLSPNSFGTGDSPRDLRDFLSQSGLIDHMIFLLKADFTQGNWSALVPGLLVKLLVWRSDTLEKEAAVNFSDKVLKSSRLLLDKVKEERSGIRLISRVVLEIMPALYSIQGDDSIVQFVHCLADLNDFCNAKNSFPLAEKMDSGTLVESYRYIDTAFIVVPEFYEFYHQMALAVIKTKKLQALPIRTAKAFLRTLAENKTNPYFDSGSQLLTLNNITRIVVQTCVPELTSYWLDWLKSNASSNPLLFDLVPAEVKYEVPFTSAEGCLDVTFKNEKIDLGKLMPLYNTIYNKYWDMVVKPLNAIKNACRNGSFRQTSYVKRDIQKIDQVKIKGNSFHKNKEFQLALVEYDKAIDMLMDLKLKCHAGYDDDPDVEYDIENLLTNCRSNRVSSNLELGRNEDAIVDATLALRELHCLLEGTEEHLWEVMDDRNDEDTLRRRDTKVRFQRVKALVNLKQWGPALQNILTVIRHEQFKELAFGYYYECLTRYIQHYKNVQFPSFCVVCCGLDTEDDKTFHQLIIRCSKCNHPYCSTDCKKKDKATHLKYCKNLTKLYRSLDKNYSCIFVPPIN